MSAPADVPISIHAPVKSATWSPKLLEIKIQISIHAPVKSATFILKLQDGTIKISIHAPVKSATHLTGCFCRTILYFNPRARKERDYSKCERESFIYDFNPRARKERDFSRVLTFIELI